MSSGFHLIIVLLRSHVSASLIRSMFTPHRRREVRWNTPSQNRDFNDHEVIHTSEGALAGHLIHMQVVMANTVCFKFNTRIDIFEGWYCNIDIYQNTKVYKSRKSQDS